MATVTNGKRLCVIGAGPCGTAQLRSFKTLQDQGTAIPQVVCFEKQAELGGLWNYDWRTGLDGKGEPVHGSMYRYLWSNGPKEALEFADYGFEEHFGRAIPSYPPREVLFDYIKGRVEDAGVRPWIQFNSTVRRVTHSEETSLFTVVVESEGSEISETFDHVVVASGHFSTPHVPSFPGFEKFEGRILHAHDFRDAVEFRDKDVLIIGSSYSAEDISSQLYKYGVNHVTLCYRTAPMPFSWPSNFNVRPLLTHVNKDTCYFKDGTSQRVDAIILCTGYLHHFPFMEDKLKLKTKNRLTPAMLHKGIFFKDNHNLIYLGMQDQWFTFNMFDIQAWYARDVILGRITLSPAEVLENEYNALRSKEDSLEGDEANIRFQAEYMQDLQSQIDYPYFDIEGCVQLFLEWEHNKHTDIMDFRNHSHRSVKTGTLAPIHHTPWLYALDDSMPCYLDNSEGPVDPNPKKVTSRSFL